MTHIDTAPTQLLFRRTKIVATIGPASNSPAMLTQLINAGINVVRLNFSHGSHSDHRITYERIRAAAQQAQKHIAVLADLGGPKIRVGSFVGGAITLAAGTHVRLTTRAVQGSPGLIPSQYAGLHRDVNPGQQILLDDGNLALRVESIEGPDVLCQVINGGVLKDHKGMNLPRVALSIPALTDKDRDDAEFALALGVDLLALSFVRRAADVLDLRQLVEKSGRTCHIIAKIEKPEALDNIAEILNVADGLMVARGDLGVEIAPQAVPYVQEQLIDLAREAQKPIIVATQMLESMVEHPRPTRAEVADISHAVKSGTDAVMLSAETASGAYPVEAVAMMDAVIRQTEAQLWKHGAFASLRNEGSSDNHVLVEAAIAEATALLSRQLMVRGIVVLSKSGRSIAVMSAARPAAPIVGVSPDAATAQAMNLLWGVMPVTGDEQRPPNELARSLARSFGLAHEGQTILMVRGFSQNPGENTPSITAITV